MFWFRSFALLCNFYKIKFDGRFLRLHFNLIRSETNTLKKRNPPVGAERLYILWVNSAENNNIIHIETSAKNDNGIQKIFEIIGKKQIDSPVEESNDILQNYENNNNKKNSCC